MKPDVNSKVQILFKSGFQVEGVVVSWGKEIVLASNENHSTMVITKPNQIVMYSVTDTYTSQSNEERQSVDTYNFRGMQDPDEIVDSSDYMEGALNDLTQEVYMPEEPMSPEYLRLKSLVDLHKLKIEEEKKTVANKLKQQHISEPRKAQYTSHDQIPGFYKK